jgi:hypothetical protein
VFANELSEHAKMDYEGNKQKRIYCEAELNFCNFLIGRVVHIHPDGGCFDTDFSA